MYNRSYAVPYVSVSKGSTIAIEDETKFNDFHLCAAVQKVRSILIVAGAQSHEVDTFEALCRECGYRDLNPAYKGGKSDGDHRIPVREGEARLPDAGGPADEGFA